VFVLGDALGLWKEQNHMTGMSISALENGGINVLKKRFLPFLTFAIRELSYAYIRSPSFSQYTLTYA
jgi:hypothetical protein